MTQFFLGAITATLACAITGIAWSLVAINRGKGESLREVASLETARFDRLAELDEIPETQRSR